MAYIYQPPGESYGDPWSGYTYYATVELMNFLRPDTGNILKIKLSYALHDLSGQMDDWTIEADGILATESAVFRALFDPTTYDCFQRGNYMRIKKN